jgi:hypothetical protein
MEIPAEIMINSSLFNYSQLDFSGQAGPINALAVIKDLCDTINLRVLQFAFFILIYFVLNTIVLPRGYNGIDHFARAAGYDWLMDDYITPAYKHIISLVETFGLGGAIGLIVFFYFQQGLPLWAWIIVSILGVFVGLAAIGEIVAFIRKKWGKA